MNCKGTVKRKFKETLKINFKGDCESMILFVNTWNTPSVGGAQHASRSCTTDMDSAETYVVRCPINAMAPQKKQLAAMSCG